MMSEYSQDNGKSFQPAGNPIQFRPGLTKRMYVGLAITAFDASQVTEAKFSGLEVRRR